jgi:tRNA (mo5U34)-methyltransferase
MNMRSGKNMPARLGPWFHNLHLPDGTETAPNHPFGDFPAFKWKTVADHLPADLRGWTALDVGCNAGYYSFELARRGADVTGVDMDPRYLEQARWAARRFKLPGRTRFERMQVYDLAATGRKWDLVLFLGLMYHLRYPLLGLDIVAAKAKRILLFQTLTMPGREVFRATGGRGLGGKLGLNAREVLLKKGWPKLAFLEHGFAGDPTNWWCPNHAAVEAMLRSSGMAVTARPAPEFYLCRPDPARPSPAATWNESEYLSAVGRPWKAKAARKLNSVR